MIAIVSLFMVVILSILVTRVATVALTHTGLSREAARFQARSAFTGVGFTTSESEKVVGHPFRRRILLLLMLLGNAGFVTAVTSLILTFVKVENPKILTIRVGFLVLGLVVLWTIASSKWLEQRMSNWISRLLKRYTRLDVRDYHNLLHLAGEYRVTELEVEEDDWLANRTLMDLGLRQEGVMVLGITRRDGTYLGVPVGSSTILPGDTIIIYGRASSFEELDERRAGWTGEDEHRKAVVRQRTTLSRETEEAGSGKSSHKS